MAGHRIKVERNKEIKELRKKGVTLIEIGRRYGISKQRVYCIVNKKRTEEE